MQKMSMASPMSALQHLRRTLFGALRGIFVFGLLGLLAGIAGTEAAGAILTGALPTLPTHIAAGVIGVLLGYALSLTVAFRALLLGLVQSMEWVVGEVERLAGGVVHEAESVLHLPQDVARAATSAIAPVPAPVGGTGASGASGGMPHGGMIGGIQDEP